MAQGTTAAKADKDKDTAGTRPPAAAGEGGGTTDGNTAVPGTGDHDRVQMLSLRADGTPDQTPRVEMIGDPETSKAATAEQFRQQAVSAEDVRLRGVTSTGVAGDPVEQDPAVQKLIDAHDAVAADATAAAERTVDELLTGESEKVPDTNPSA